MTERMPDTLAREAVFEWLEECQDLMGERGLNLPIEEVIENNPGMTIEQAKRFKRDFLITLHQNRPPEQEAKKVNVVDEEKQRLAEENAYLTKQVSALGRKVEEERDDRVTVEREIDDMKEEMEHLRALIRQAQAQPAPASQSRPNPPATGMDPITSLLLQTKDDQIANLRSELSQARSKSDNLEKEIRDLLMSTPRGQPGQAGQQTDPFRARIETLMLERAIKAIETGGATEKEKSWVEYLIDSGQLPLLAKEVGGLIPLLAGNGSGGDAMGALGDFAQTQPQAPLRRQHNPPRPKAHAQPRQRTAPPPQQQQVHPRYLQGNTASPTPPQQHIMTAEELEDDTEPTAEEVREIITKAYPQVPPEIIDTAIEVVEADLNENGTMMDAVGTDNKVVAVTNVLKFVSAIGKLNTYVKAIATGQMKEDFALNFILAHPTFRTYAMMIAKTGIDVWAEKLQPFAAHERFASDIAYITSDEAVVVLRSLIEGVRVREGMA